MGVEPIVRITLILLLVLSASPAASAAQPAALPPPAELGPIGLPLPPIGGPLPSIGLPLKDGRALPAARGADRRPPAGEPPQRRRSGASIVYVVPAYPWHVGPSPAAAPAEHLPASFAPSGRLRLEVEPAGRLQVFVDDVYVGMPGDTGGEIDLAPGVRRVELRAAGYRTLTIDVRVVAERTVTYRSALTPEAPEPVAQIGDGAAETLPPVVSMGSRTIYAIPGCYLGNVPPQDVKLPAGCDLARLEIHTP